ncbi:MAG: secretin and TonB N-terminal domain-containing protein [Longimicrobiales bacterium]
MVRESAVCRPAVPHGRRDSGVRVLALLAFALGVAACGGNPEPGEPQARVELGPPPEEAVRPASEDTAADPPARAGQPDEERAGEALPSLPVDQVERSGESWPRIESLEAVNQELRTVLRSVAQQYGLEFRIDPNVEGRVTTTLRNATLREALDAIVLPHGYTYELENNTLRVEPARVVSRMFDLDFISLSRVGVGTTVIQRRLGSNFRGGSTGATGGVTGGGGGVTGAGGVPGGGADVITSVEVTDLWEDIRVALEGLVFAEVRSPEEAGLQQQSGTGLTGGLGGRAPQTTSRVTEDGRRLIVNPAAGTILVSAAPRILDEVELFIDSFESAIQRQVRIEAKFVEVVLDREHEFGIDWSVLQNIGDLDISLQRTAGSGGLEFRLATGSDRSITAVLDALESQGDVRVLSSPGVTALNNQRAVFNVTTEEVFFAVTREPIRDASGNVIQFQTTVETQPVAVGIVMDVLPQISSDDVITMNVRPMVTSLDRVVEFEQDDNFARAPVVDRRELDTMVRVRSGETHVIGGLIQTREETQRSGVPVLKDLPVLGWLFGRTVTRERRSELVIFITPTIIAGHGTPAP